MAGAFELVGLEPEQGNGVTVAQEEPADHISGGIFV
jgi:hypothetical protein